MSPAESETIARYQKESKAAMSSTRQKIIFLTFLFFAVSLYGNQLDYYINAALKNNFLLKSSYYDTIEKNDNYKFINSQKFPQINISPEIDSINYKNDNHLNSSVNLILSLDLSKVFSDYSKSDFYLKKKSELEQQYVKQQIVFNIKKIYFELFIKDQERKTVEESISYISNHLETLRNLSRYGVENYKLNLFRVQTEKANIAIQLNDLESRITILKSDLAGLTGVEITNIGFSIPSEYSNFAIAEKKEKFLSLKILEFQKKAIESTVHTEKLYWLPDIFINTGYNMDNDSTGPGNYYEIKAGVNTAILNFGVEANKIKALQNKKKKIDCLLNETAREIELKYETLKQDIMNGHNNYEIVQNAEKIALNSLELATQEYKQGMVNEMDLLDIYRKLIEIQFSKNEQLLQYLKKVAELELIIGE